MKAGCSWLQRRMKNSRLLSCVPEICSGISFHFTLSGKPCCQRSLDVDFRRQGSMDGTVFGNFEQSAPLGIIQVSDQFDLTIDSIEKTFFRFALHAIFRVNGEMLK